MDRRDGAANDASREAASTIDTFHLDFHLRSGPKRPSGFHQGSSRAHVDDDEMVAGAHAGTHVCRAPPRAAAAIRLMTHGSRLRTHGLWLMAYGLQIGPAPMDVVVLKDAHAS